MANRILTWCIATVWLVNGLFCKVLNLVPRHQIIVESVLNLNSAQLPTVLIGLLEICMAIWILSRYEPRINAAVQIIVVLGMNIIEFTLVPHLLLWGRINILFAFAFVLVVYYNGWHTKANTFENQQP